MVLRPLLLRAALGAVTALATGVAIAPSAAAAAPPGASAAEDDHLYPVPASYDAPLLVTIDELTPGELPRRGPVVVSGTVVNRDVEPWIGIAVYPVINAGSPCEGCPLPITTTAELAEAAEIDPETVVGNRITQVSATIDELEPGEVEPYSIRVPRNLLEVTTAGVYWFGVHALGASASTPDDSVADGRARTFLPYIPRGRDGVRGKIDTAVVVPLRHRIRYVASGRLARKQDWEAAFESDGELGGPLAFGAAAVGRPVTWLVDPAVPDAARRLRRGNPPRDLGPDETDAGAPADEAGDDATDDTETSADDAVARTAGDWLDSLEVQLRGEEVLALPYGDLDMSATPERLPELYRLARERPGDLLSAWETPTTPAIASPGGYLDPSAIAGIDDDSTLLVTDRMFYPSDDRRGPPVVGEYDAHTIAVTSYGAASGGPGPEPRHGAVSFRQRVLAEAALRLIAPGRRHPLIVVVPRTVDGEAGSTFWGGMDPAWLNLTTVADATARTPTVIDPTSLTYPLDQETDELDSAVFTEAEQLIEAGSTLQNLYPEADSVAADVRAEAFAGASYHLRTDPEGAADRLARSRRWIERQFRKVGIDGPPAVTLSSADGTFAVTVTNDLDRTVTVRLAAESVGDEVEVEVGEPIVLAADSRTTVQLETHTRGTGVHNVTLAVTDLDGTPLGSSVEVPIRSGQVSEVIWVILGAGGTILFVAIALRLYRRIRDHRRGSGAPTTGEA